MIHKINSELRLLVWADLRNQVDIYSLNKFWLNIKVQTHNLLDTQLIWSQGLLKVHNIEMAIRDQNEEFKG